MVFRSFLVSRLFVGICVKGSCCRCCGLSKSWFLVLYLYIVVVFSGYVLYWGWVEFCDGCVCLVSWRYLVFIIKGGGGGGGFFVNVYSL